MGEGEKKKLLESLLAYATVWCCYANWSSCETRDLSSSEQVAANTSVATFRWRPSFRTALRCRMRFCRRLSRSLSASSESSASRSSFRFAKRSQLVANDAAHAHHNHRVARPAETAAEWASGAAFARHAPSRGLPVPLAPHSARPSLLLHSTVTGALLSLSNATDPPARQQPRRRRLADRSFQETQ